MKQIHHALDAYDRACNSIRNHLPKRTDKNREAISSAVEALCQAAQGCRDAVPSGEVFEDEQDGTPFYICIVAKDTMGDEVMLEGTLYFEAFINAAVWAHELAKDKDGIVSHVCPSS